MNKNLVKSLDSENDLSEKELRELRKKCEQAADKLTTAERKILIQEMMLKTSEKNEFIMKEQIKRLEQNLKNEENRSIVVQEEKGNRLLREQID